jgi:hypothetical protein
MYANLLPFFAIPFIRYRGYDFQRTQIVYGLGDSVIYSMMLIVATRQFFLIDIGGVECFRFYAVSSWMLEFEFGFVMTLLELRESSLLQLQKDSSR